MDSIIINGGHRLSGSVDIQGSKNAVLPIMAASVLINGITVVKNYPPISDVYSMAELLTDIGCCIIYEDDEMIIDTTNAFGTVIDNEAAKNIRASVLMLGVMLSRFGSVKMPLPGGCNIGKRPIDIHLSGLKRLNATWSIYDDYVYIESRKLVGNDVYLSYPSVGATENVILGAIMAEGITYIHNAAIEPEVMELCSFFVNAGAIITGIGSRDIVIEGVKKLEDTAYTVNADRIVAGTYMCACIACGGEIELNRMKLTDTIGYLDVLQGMGLKVEQTDTGIIARSQGSVSAVNYIESKPYPGFPTDMQQIVMSVLCKSNGKSIIRETIFEDRLGIAEELAKMKASIHIINDTALISGVGSLYGSTVTARDLRGAAALVVAALSAKGSTRIEECHYIRRGYTNICRDLRKLGADIEWEDQEKRDADH